MPSHALAIPLPEEKYTQPCASIKEGIIISTHAVKSRSFAHANL